jgi:adenylyltransferase/sulfurtransferase
MPRLDFSEDEIQRYARHILLPEIGGVGQAALRDSRVLIVGAGGLGCPVLLYLAAAGIGTIGLVDDDRVELSNLQRQIAHTTGDVGAPKVASALASARAINPLVRLVPHELRLDAGNVAALVAEYDIVCDGTDNFAARAVLAAACRQAEKTLVSASVTRFEGQLALFRAPADGLACYRCVYPEAPPPGASAGCAEAGVLGAVAGVMGTLQATEVLKEILGIGETLAGRLLMWDALAVRLRAITLVRDPDCPLCGRRAQAPDDEFSLHAHGLAPL